MSPSEQHIRHTNYVQLQGLSLSAVSLVLIHNLHVSHTQTLLQSVQLVPQIIVCMLSLWNELKNMWTMNLCVCEMIINALIWYMYVAASKSISRVCVHSGSP